MLSTNPLNQPVGALMRYSEIVGPNDSLARAAWLLRESPAASVPVVENGRLLGLVTDRSLARALEEGIGNLSSVSSVLETGCPTIPSFATGAEALRRFADVNSKELVVVDAEGRFQGLLSPSDLFPRVEAPPLLPTVGGMATPFGVYLTAGGMRAGAGHLALVSTGMALFALLLGATLAGTWLADWAAISLGLARYHAWMLNALPVVLFLVGMRTMPIAGTHAAEHKVVHALENGEPLELEVVQRMPRVHPRCGTNIAVAIGIFISLASFKWIDVEQIRLVVALLVTVFVWRPIGHFMQFFVTTKTPSDRQLLNGIEAGRELIRNVQGRRRARPSILQRILASGMLHVMAGSLLMYGLALLVAGLFRLDLRL